MASSTTRGLSLLVALALAAALAAPAAAATVTRTETVTAAAVGGKVNVNTASVKDLMTLAGVGRKVAEKIVQHREKHGPFKQAEDVKNVEGVGPGVLEKNRGRIVTK